MLFLYCNSITVAWIKLDKLFLIIRQCWGKTLRASVIALVLVLASSFFDFVCITAAGEERLSGETNQTEQKVESA